MSNESLLLRQLASAIDRQESILALIGHADEQGIQKIAADQFGGTSGLTVSCPWASSCDGHKDVMEELNKCVRRRASELLAEVRIAAQSEVQRLRQELAGNAGGPKHG